MYNIMYHYNILANKQAATEGGIKLILGGRFYMLMKQNV